MQLCDTINLCSSSNYRYTYNTLVKFLAVGSYLFLSPNNCGQEEAVKKLENRTIIAAAVDQPSFYHSVKFKPSQSSLVEFEGGINVEAYRFLRDSLNFQEKALKSRGQMNTDENGELQNEGIAEVLNSNKADIAISLFEPLPYRVAGPYGVRFLHPVFKSSKAIAVFTQPPKSSRNVFGDPFQRTVWMAVFLVDIFAILTLWIFLYINKGHNERRLSFMEIFRRVHIWTICIFTRQSTILYESSQTTYLKVALLVSFFTTFIFHSLYSSALTSMLAVDYKPISSFDQIMQGPYLLYYDKYVPFIKNVLDTYQQPTRKIVEMGPEAQKIMNKALPEIFDSRAALLTSEDRYYSFFRKRKHDSVFCNKLSNVLSRS